MWDIDEQIRRVYENPYERSGERDLCLESYECSWDREKEIYNA